MWSNPIFRNIFLWTYGISASLRSERSPISSSSPPMAFQNAIVTWKKLKFTLWTCILQDDISLSLSLTHTSYTQKARYTGRLNVFRLQTFRFGNAFMYMYIVYTCYLFFLILIIQFEINVKNSYLVYTFSAYFFFWSCGRDSAFSVKKKYGRFS